MKNFFKRSGLIVGCALAAVLLALLIASIFGGGLHSLRDLFSPVDRLVNAGMTRLEHIYGYMYKYDELEAENAELKARIGLGGAASSPLALTANSTSGKTIGGMTSAGWRSVCRTERRAIS